MKRFIGLLLILCLLCPTALPVLANETQQTEETPLPLAFDPAELELRDGSSYIPDLGEQGRGATRDALEDNLAFTGPLVKEHTFMPNGVQNFTLGLIQTGKTGQYYCIFLYEGKEPKGEPVSTTVEAFGEKVGIFTKNVSIYISDLAPGRYTLVTCTAEKRNNTLYPVDGTAFMTDVYCCEDYRIRWQLFLQDPETKERIRTVKLSPGEDITMELGRSPLPCDGSGDVSVTCTPNLVTIKEAGGYIYLAPTACGSGMLTIIHKSTKVIYVPIYVCTKEGGHFPEETYEAFSPTVSDKGLSVNVCRECGTVYREAIPSLGSAFDSLQDLSQDAWYYESVKEAVYRNLFKGVTASAFQPNRPMTRAMLVTVLWRMEGCPAIDRGQFADVAEDAWYAQAVNWAAENGIVNGVGHGRFAPDGSITREQMAAILYRYAGYLSLDLQGESVIESFIDGASVRPWAGEAMNWAVTKSLIGGVKEGDTIFLRPQGNATRAQVCAILIRFLHAYEAPAPQVAYPDPTDALESGEWEGLSWAFHEDGRLVIGGQGSIPGWTDSYPWISYVDRILSIEFLYGVESVGDYVFSEFPRLQTVIMADSLTTLEEGAFTKCTALSHVVLSRNLKEIKQKAFEGCSSLEQIDFPYGLRRIGYNAFQACTSLKAVVLPDSITGHIPGKDYSRDSGSIGERAFAGCTSLESVCLPMAETVIPRDLFSGCTSLKEVILPFCVESICVGAFEHCSSLESITIPQTFNNIQEGAFAYCSSLKAVYILSTTYTVSGNLYASMSQEEGMVFSDPGRVTLYGFVGSRTEYLAKERGYAFVDIMTVME